MRTQDNLGCPKGVWNGEVLLYYALSQLHRNVYKRTPGMRIQAVPRAPGMERFYYIMPGPSYIEGVYKRTQE